MATTEVANISVSITESAQGTGFLSDELFAQLLGNIICGVFPIICATGIFTNALNMFAFSRLGLHDNVTICFFSLSLSDLCFLVLVLHNTISYTVGFLRPNSSVFIPDLNYYISWYFRMFYDISVITTTFIAIQRGCSVAFPFQFKGVFTRSRTLMVIGVIYGIILGCYMPIFSTVGLAPLTNPVTNLTLVVLFHRAGWQQALAIPDIFNKVILTFTGETLVLISLFVIMVGMLSSSEFRRASATGQSHREKSQQRRQENAVKHGQEAHESRANTTIPRSQKRKEVKVLRQVTLVSAVYVTCNTPQILQAIISRIVPEYNYSQRYANLFWLVFTFINIFEIINASVNFFIYYHFNAKFREIVLSPFQK